MKRKQDEIIRIQYGDSSDPHSVLGRHTEWEGQIIRAFHPDAEAMKVLFADGSDYDMQPMERTKVYEVYVHGKDNIPYKLEAFFSNGGNYIYSDPYSYAPVITKRDLYMFGKGNHYTIYEKLGAHPMTIDGVRGTYFAVWAPGARRVSVVGDFCLWDGRRFPMRKMGSVGIFELFIPDLMPGAVYKYEIKTEEGKLLVKSDPYGHSSQLRPQNGSVVAHIDSYHWDDQSYMRRRRKKDLYKSPMAVYEVHLSSWRRGGTEGSEILDYKTLAHELADYVKSMGYTHVELMGICEHPFDGSWGYQVTGYYAPTSRHGKAEDFMYFVDYLHLQGIGVILDWVPGHFSKDPQGLGRFDGTCLYEHPDPKKGTQPQWDTLVFHYERPEVKNFLIANALYWLKKYHIDGIRVDAVASMLYLDFGREHGQWNPNRYGGREHLEGIAFLKELNDAVKKHGGGGFLIAEESSAFQGVSTPTEKGGLGFDFKWNMGWMHDFLKYMKEEPVYRKYHHRDLIFSMDYSYDEHFIQALSHDEVVHMKGSMLGKMKGTDEEKFANLRLTYGYMFGHPGKKHLFMGQDFGQWAEWNEGKSLDWYLLQYGAHYKMQQYVKQLLKLYKKYKAFHELDYERWGFEWMSRNNEGDCNISFVRRNAQGKKNLLFVYNFSAASWKEYRVGVPKKGKYTLILSSNEAKYGGTGKMKTKKIQMSSDHVCDGMGQSIIVSLPPFTMLVFEY